MEEKRKVKTWFNSGRDRYDSEVKEVFHLKKLLWYFIPAILILLMLFSDASPFFVVSSGERGVVVSKLSGTVQESYGEGLHLKTPIIDSAHILEVRTKKYETTATSASKDLQVVTAVVVVNYHILPDNTYKVYQTIGNDYENRVIDPSVQEVVKSVTAKYIAEELITKRELVKDDIKEALKERLATYNLVLDDFSLKNFDFSQEFNSAIEAKVTAEQNALKEQNNLKVVEFQAQQKVASAEGDAKAIEIINQQLTKSPQYIQFFLLQKWDGKMPVALGSNSILSITSTQDGGGNGV